MSIPALGANGFLPTGVHDCTFDELKIRFGSFQGSDRRPNLMRKLKGFIAECQSAGFVRYLLVDGSFVTASALPNDIDLVLVLMFSHDLKTDLPPNQYNLVSKKNVLKRYGFDIIAVRENTQEYDEAVAFFEQVRGQRNVQKGILRLQL
jgi:hypothetical protein